MRSHFQCLVNPKIAFHFLALTVVERAGQSDGEPQSDHAQAFGGSVGGTPQQTHPPHPGQTAAEEDLRGTVEPSQPGDVQGQRRTHITRTRLHSCGKNTFTLFRTYTDEVLITGV